jgi:uncharacterized membrane protein
MKKSLHVALLTNLLIVLAMAIVGAWLFESLPEQVPSHWNAAGEVDDYMGKTLATVLIPGITLLMAVLFPILGWIDPLKKNYEKFKRAWGVLQVSIIAFMAYVYFVTMYAALNSGLDVGTFIIAGVGVLFVLIGYCIGEIKRNYFVGIRTPWTLHNEKVWDKTHQLGKWCFMGAGVVLFANAFFLWHTVAVMFVAVILASVVPIIYSYLIYRGR